MKLVNLIPLKESEASAPELCALPFFREFQTSHGFKPLFKFLGTKSEEHIFVADVEDFGALDLVVKEAKIYAKICVKDKYAVFGLVYTMSDLKRSDAVICLMKQKDNKIECVAYDSKDKKNFDAKTVNFLKLVDDEK